MAARAAFMKARTQLEEEVRVHPDNMGLLSDLGLIDAALGRKEEALSEGRRAVDLLPITKDAPAGAQMLTNLAITMPGLAKKNSRLSNWKKLCGFRVWSPMADCVCIRCGTRCAAIRASKKS